MLGNCCYKGLCTGVIILLTTGGKSSRFLAFSEDLFFIYLLPPIIFNAGFQGKKKQFFCNFMTIMLFGAIGTLISFAIISFASRTDLSHHCQQQGVATTDFSQPVFTGVAFYLGAK